MEVRYFGCFQRISLAVHIQDSMASVEHALHCIVCLPGRIRNGARVAVFIVSLARRYDYSGTEDTATSFRV